jgi:tripartite-type tricarboxylate transporter receptor subunit TctC
MGKRRTLLAAMMVAPFCALPVAPATAQTNWPAKPVTIIVPGSAGGTTDAPARIVARKLGERLGQSVVVENIVGAGGKIGVQTLLNRPADGYTIIVGNTGTHAINYSVYKDVRYKPDDFIALTDMMSFANVLLVSSRSKIQTVGDLIAELKRSPGRLTFSSAGLGQTTHLTPELFKARTGTFAVHVPYKGSSPASYALLSGEVDFMFDNLSNAMPYINGGKLRALAVTSEARMPQLPSTPTMAQAGLNDFVVTVFLGFFVSSRTPPDVVNKLKEALLAVTRDPEVIAQFRNMGGVPGGKDPAKFAEFVTAERLRWAQIIKDRKIDID